MWSPGAPATGLTCNELYLTSAPAAGASTNVAESTAITTARCARTRFSGAGGVLSIGVSFA